MPSRCHCCRRNAASLALVSRDGAAERWRADICGSCARWLHETLTAARNDTPELFGAPTTNGRDLLFDDQCRLCRRLSEAAPAYIALTQPNGAPVPFPNLGLCPSCDAWLASLARDGRSARNAAARDIDGGYGTWLHPNLRSLRVAVDVADAAARGAILAACADMGVTAELWRDAKQPAVLFVEVPGRSFRATDRALAQARQVLLAPLAARRELLEALTPTVVDWLTVPVTPQQITAALTRALVLRGRNRAWDHALGLPAFAPGARMPAALHIEPTPGVDPFEVVWLLKRFARGYDEAGVLAGEVLLVPRVPAERLAHVAERLAAVFGARATVSLREERSIAPRLHVAG